MRRVLNGAKILDRTYNIIIMHLSWSLMLRLSRNSILKVLYINERIDLYAWPLEDIMYNNVIGFFASKEIHGQSKPVLLVHEDGEKEKEKDSKGSLVRSDWEGC